MEGPISSFHQEHEVLSLNCTKYFKSLQVFIRTCNCNREPLSRIITWGSFHDPAEPVLFGRTAGFPDFVEEEATDVTLSVRGRGTSSSVAGLGGVGVRRS